MIDYKRKQKQPMHFLLNFEEIELASECVFTLHCRVMPKKYLITEVSKHVVNQTRVNLQGSRSETRFFSRERGEKMDTRKILNTCSLSC